LLKFNSKQFDVLLCCKRGGRFLSSIPLVAVNFTLLIFWSVDHCKILVRKDFFIFYLGHQEGYTVSTFLLAV
jgi:hypothetical protein